MRDELQALRDKVGRGYVCMQLLLAPSPGASAATPVRRSGPATCKLIDWFTDGRQANELEIKIDKEINMLKAAVEITKNETIKYSLGLMLAFATAGLGAARLFR